jgi:hypothetical protein
MPTTCSGIVTAALNDYARTLRGPTGLAANRAYTVGASEIGQCQRKTWYVKHDGPRDPDYVETWGATLRGQIIERAFLVPALRARFGADLKFAGERQRQFRKGFLSSTPDTLLAPAPRDILAPFGILDIRSDCLPIEGKSIDPRVKLDAPNPSTAIRSSISSASFARPASISPTTACSSTSTPRSGTTSPNFPSPSTPKSTSTPRPAPSRY